MPNEMNHAEVKESIKWFQSRKESFTLGDKCAQAEKTALSVLSRIARGKLVEVVHAHWIYTSEPNEDCMGGFHDVIQCSACKEGHDFEYDYCPSCGALMDGKDDNHEAN